MKLFSFIHFTPYTWKKYLGIIPFALARNAFLWIIIIILLEIVYGEFLLYRYTIQAVMEEVVQESTITTFQESTYRTVLEKMNQRADRFRATDVERYPNPFIP